MWHHKQPQSTLQHIMLILLHLISFSTRITKCFLFFPRSSSYGYLAAVAMPLNLPNRDVYMAFNLESNYGLPSNDSYNEWIDRWNLAQEDVGIGNDVTAIDGRKFQQRSPLRRYTRSSFYHSFVGYLDHFEKNGTACLLRTVCEVSESSLEENNGLLGSIFKILFMPTTSMPETEDNTTLSISMYEAEHHGKLKNCAKYVNWCPEGFLNMISEWF